MSKAVPIRELLNISAVDINEQLRTDLNILWEDNKVSYISYKELIVTRYLMELITLVPEIAITSKYELSKYYTNDFYTSKTFNKWLSVCVEDIVAIRVKPNNDNRDILDTVAKCIWDIINRIFNEVVYNVIDYAGGMNIEDLLEVQMKDKLLKSIEYATKNPSIESINKSYEALEDVIYNDHSIKDNQIVKGYISGSVNPNQAKQLLACRGFVTEIDNFIFKYPITTSYTLGLNNMYYLAVESRPGARALHISNKAVQTSEYFAREMQLVTMVVEVLEDGDCGNKEYIDWYVRTATENNRPDLPNLVGKRYFNPKTGKEEVITIKDTHLEGTTIKLRSVLNCKLKDPTHICTACFGELSYSVTKGSNIGHFCSTEVSEKTTQGMLSTKHLTSSATSAGITISPATAVYFSIENKNNYVFKKTVLQPPKNTRFRIVIDQVSGFGIKDLTPHVDVYKLITNRVTRISDIVLEKVKDDEVVESLPIVIKEGNKYGSFSYEMLDYIAKNGYTMDDQDRHVIDMANWKSKDPIIVMPETEYDFLTLVKETKSLFKSENIVRSPEGMLQKLFDTLNYKLDINVALLEVIVYAFTVTDDTRHDYHLARNVDNKVMAKIGDIMRNRSLGGGYAWERLLSIIYNPKSFTKNNNINHPLDVMIKPNEVLLEQQSRG